MFPDSPFAHPVSSFQHPVPVPGVDPDSTPFIWVGFNQAWLSYIIGSLQQLLLQSSWKVSSSDELQIVQQQAFNLLYLFSTYINSAPILGSAGVDTGDDIMIRQDPSNPCLLQTSINGVDWCTFADISKCVPAVGQPGAGAPQPAPGGGSQQYCSQLTANGKVIIPTVVNTGDTISLDSSSGAGNDGGSTEWFCPDGSEFFAGLCNPLGKQTNPSDPLNTSSHMCIIANIGGTYYDMTSGMITVPGGVSDAPVTIQVNDSNLTDNLGSYQICVTVVNHQSATWGKTFNLPVSPSTTTNSPNGRGTYVSGSGWEAVVDHNPPANDEYFNRMQVFLPFAARNVTHIHLEYQITLGTFHSGGESSRIVQSFLVGTPTTIDDLLFSAATSGTIIVDYYPGATMDKIGVYIAAGSDVTNPSGGGGSATLTQISLEGTGSNPFA